MSFRRSLKWTLSASILAAAASCQASPIDPIFGRNGHGADELFWINKDLYASATTADEEGNLYIVGNLYDGTQDPFVYSQSSSGLDRGGYGGSPVAINSAFAGLPNYATSAVADPEGRVLVGGYITLPLATCPDGNANTSYAYVTRFTVDGTVDSSFGSGGPFAGSSFIRLPCSSPYQTVLGIQSSAKIVVGTTAWPYDNSSARILVSRMSADGITDGDFGSSGNVSLNTPVSDEDMILADFHVSKNDELVVSGLRRSRDTYDATADLFKLTADGEMDNTFGESGIYHFVPTDPAFLTSTAINSSDEIYFAASDLNDGNMSVTRLTASGNLDSRFGTHGNAIFSVGGYNTAPQHLIVDSHDRLNVVGYAQDWQYDSGEIFLLHLNTDGTINKAMGSAGIYTQPCGFFYCSMSGALIDAKNRPIIASYTNGQVFLFRYDELFGTGFD